MKKLFAASLLLFNLGCGAGAPAEPPPRSIQAIDQSMVATTQMNLKTDPELAASGITVMAENNLLVLRGTVPNEAAKKRAEELAKKTARVEKVANHLEVSGEAVAPDF